MMTRTLCLGLVLAGAVMGQGVVTFEPQTPACSYTFPVGCNAPGDPEGCTKNGVVATNTVDVANGLGMPCQGLQYARVSAEGPFAVPSGGPAVGAGGNQLYIPIPLGSTAVGFCWDFYNSEGTSTTFNDGMAVDVVGSNCGASIAQLAYADAATSTVHPGQDSLTACGSFGSDTVVAGPQFYAPAPLPVGSVYLRVMVWNGGDNAVASAGVIDDILFFSGPIPCTLFFDSPFGPGSLRMQNIACPPVALANYIIGVTLVQGLTPNGWFHGLDIPLGQLISEFSSGYPFTGVLDATGASTFGPIFAPSGLQLWAVSTQWSPGYGNFLFSRGATTYTIP
jgi:hypothetical protein